jgi:Acetyltransferase (GNAT) domain
MDMPLNDIKLSSRKYDEVINDLIAFMNSNRGIKRNINYYNWKYLQRPHGLSPIIITTENDQGEIIGSLSLIPHQFMINNTTNHIGILGDIAVTNAWRRHRVGQRMFKYLLETEEARILRANFVLPNEAAASALAKSNWITIDNMEKYVKLINVEKRAVTKIKSKWLLKIVTTILNHALKALTIETYMKLIVGYTGEAANEFDEQFDILWNSVDKTGMIFGMRNKQYLTWRYANHPAYIYKIFTLKQKSRLCGYIIYHINNGSCYIDDVLFLKERSKQIYLFVYFLKSIKSSNINEIILTMNNNNYFNLPLILFGFFKRPNKWSVMISGDDKKCSDYLLNGKRWYITQGDKDT